MLSSHDARQGTVCMHTNSCCCPAAAAAAAAGAAVSMATALSTTVGFFVWVLLAHVRFAAVQQFGVS
jgi:hypothetical protein